MNENKVIILGAGPAGMACAMELYKQNIKVVVIEKDKKVGGLAKTLEFQEGEYKFRTDIGPHRFFSKNKYLYDFIEDLLQEQWLLVNRKTRQLIDGKYYDYPVKAMQAFKNLGVFKTIGMISSYLQAIFIFRILKKKINNFEDYIISNFGKKLGEFNMLNYTEKIWGISCKKIHLDWASQRIKGLNLRSVLKDVLFKKYAKDLPKTLVDQFYYPQFGTGTIYEAIAKRIQKNNSEVFVNSFPTQIIHDDKTIKQIELNINGEMQIMQPSKLVSSIPINELINLLNPLPPEEILKAATNLKWRAQVYLFITLDKERITDDNWVYFPNKEIPFGRITEMKNFSLDMSPKDKTSLFVEFFVTENEGIWNLSEQEIYDLAIKHLESLGLFSHKEVRKFYVFKKKNVYPIYDLEYQKHLATIKEYLNEFSNLFYIGRPGRFQYTNQDHSLEMGILTAKGIIENKKYDLESIGTEKDYFEAGQIKK